jgi:hypothetical protein
LVLQKRRRNERLQEQCAEKQKDRPFLLTLCVASTIVVAAELVVSFVKRLGRSQTYQVVSYEIDSSGCLSYWIANLHNIKNYDRDTYLITNQTRSNTPITVTCC